MGKIIQSQSSRSTAEMFLLGAGSSVDAGIPDTYNMTRKALEIIGTKNASKGQTKILKFVIGGLLFQKGATGGNPYTGVNIEDLFTTIQSLSARHESEINPFVASWSPLLDEFSTQNVSQTDLRTFLNSLYEPIDKALKAKGTKKVLSPSDLSRIQPRLSKLLKQVKSSGKEFSNTNTTLINTLRDIVFLRHNKRLVYLEPLVQYSINNKSTIASLNYDNTIELVAKKLSIPITTGIEQWSKIRKINKEAKKILLLKLHGSIDWCLSAGEVTAERPIPYFEVREASSEEITERTYNPALIFGGRNKLTSEGPFLDILRKFKSELERVTRLIVVGYSFRDDHINKILTDWFNSNNRNSMTIIDPFFSNTTNTIKAILADLESTKRVHIARNSAKKALVNLLAN